MQHLLLGLLVLSLILHVAELVAARLEQTLEHAVAGAQLLQHKLAILQLGLLALVDRDHEIVGVVKHRAESEVRDSRRPV